MASFPLVTNPNEATVIIIVILAVALLSLYLRLRSNLKVPGPGFRQYLPGGNAYPLYRDSGAFATTLDNLSREYGDVYQIRFGASLALVTTVPEDIAHIYSSIDLFPRSPAFEATFDAAAPGGMLTMGRELHKTVRKTLRENFNYSMLESFHPHIVDAVNELCNTLMCYVEQESKRSIPKVVDISEEIATTTFQILLNVAFGMGMSKQECLQRAEEVDVLVDEMMKDVVGYPFRQALTCFGVRKLFIESRNKIQSVSQDFIKARLQETKNEENCRHRDVLDAILSLENVALVNTASMTMEFAVEPVSVEHMKKLNYLTCVWKETLRLHPAGAGALREVQKNVTLRGSGTVVQKGTQVMAHTARSQTHEKFWKDPMSFKPERWKSEGGRSEGESVPRGCYVPFGAGSKACVGRFLAEYEGPLILTELYRRFRFQLACEPHEVVCCSNFVDTAKTSSKVGGPLDRGLPIRVALK